MTIATICLMAVNACDNEKSEAYPPTYYGFQYYTDSPENKQIVHPGDSVTIVAVQAKKGKYLAGTDYSLSVRFKVENGDSTVTSKYHTNYDGTDNSNPTFKIKVPETVVGTSALVSFSARWSNYADGQMGTYNTIKHDDCYGAINSSCYTLYSMASGTFTLPIQQ